MSGMTSLTRLLTFYGALTAPILLRVMIREEFPGKIALISSFGADSALLIALVAEIDPTVPVLFLETGKHFPETLAYVETLKHQFGLTDIRFLTPDETMLSRTDPVGSLWETQPNRCCWLRKVEPLQRALAESGFEAVITGRKSYQTEEREGLQAIELFDDGIFRINPLANWGKTEIKEAYSKRNLPVHPLVTEGYLSIGCAPCTSKVAEGADERAGRWAHTQDGSGAQKTECGIHLPADSVPDWNV